MKADRRWWNDGRLERELEALQLGYAGVAYLGGVAVFAARRDAASLFDAACLARMGRERPAYVVRARWIVPVRPPLTLYYRDDL